MEKSNQTGKSKQTEKLKQTAEGRKFKNDWELFIKTGRTYVGMVAILEEGELSCQARVLFHIISSFSYVAGYCFATNKTLADRLGLKMTMVKIYVKELENFGFVTLKQVTISTGSRRHIYVNFSTLNKRYPQNELTKTAIIKAKLLKLQAAKEPKN